MQQKERKKIMRKKKSMKSIAALFHIINFIFFFNSALLFTSHIHENEFAKSKKENHIC
jgi:hypothetical protein